ncbi:predicted protein [Sclerotinia sclerotiorum 1980 UF-70]|uniref:Uncharacterized protein n=1 Tax=Sclerotinia sclerotiorum (strain ATCC 18683 / 1980 / Ss-1) TaxID=665079 RepID=A7EPI6_SCLS1|nr:predicted protein [Sclerotinia sclerotiorum 1980 UF-70]EDO04752.1 predicted protein [Sclerotinia sclerotiorum 1980 UF-70]
MYRSVQRIIRKFKDGSWDGGPDDSKEVPRILPDREELSNSHSFLRWLNSPDGSLYDFDDLNVGFMVDYYEETLASQSRSRNYHNSSSSIGGNREKGNQLELGPRPATPDAGGQSFSVLLDDVTNSLKRLSSLYPLLLFYNAQIGQAFPIEYLLDFCGIYVHELLWRHREYFWVIYSPAEASFCINYALKTWRRVYQHEPELFSQERFGQIPKLEADAIGRKRSGRSFRRSITSSSSSLLNDSEVRSKNIDKFLTTGIKEKREYLPKTHKINNEHHSSGPQITFETLFSDLAKSSSQNYVIKDKIISSLKRVFGGNSDSLRGTRRMIWKCKCGCTSYDDFSEWPGQEGAIVEFAKELMQAGYITQAQITRQPGRTNNWAPRKPQIGLNLISRIIPRIRQTSLPVFVQSSSKKSTVCLPVDKCRWLHLCMKKRPYATHLKPLHVCKDDEQNPLTDKTFFKALKQAYSKEKTWKDWLIFKLEKIEFIGFEACPDDYVDHIKPNDLPSTTNEYDFVPPLSSKMVPPIGPKHMLHLFQNCSAISQVNSSFYLQRIPRRKIEPITFKANSLNDNLGWGLHFVEGLNTSLAVTVMFIVSSILGIGFAICWTMLEKDIQGAFAVAAYVTSVATLAVMTWQMRAL